MRRLNLLLLTTFALSLLAISGASGAARNSKPKEQKRSELHATLTAKYGLTQQQIRQYDALQATRRKKVAEINHTPGLSQKERNKRIKAATKEFRDARQRIFTPAQAAVLAGERDGRADRHARTSQILKDYRKKRIAIISKRPGKPEREKAIVELDKKCENQLAMVVGKDRAHRLIVRQQGKIKARTNDAKRYKLSYADAQKYKRLETMDERRHNALDNTDLTRRERAGRTRQIEELRDAQFKELLGDDKFRQWTGDKHPGPERQLKKQLGLNGQQVAQYKDIKNRAAVAVFKIRHGRETPQQKQVRIEQVKTEADQKLRAMMTSAQFDKMLFYRHKRQDSPRRKAIDAHTVKPPHAVNR
ncbi:hypothetical protein FACS1894159_01910 [Bacteroidia bacterium]|nr:hypothetical protein FACS1894159_01910 [Bacteroidia bacterium]